MNDINERVLDAWLKISSSINNNRLVPKLTYNEAIVCHYVYLDDSQETASSLCEKTGILKSQMNRVLTSLIEKDLVYKERSTIDKRDIYIRPNIHNNQYYLEHAKIIEVVNKITTKLGIDKCLEVIEIFNLVASIAKEEL